MFDHITPEQRQNAERYYTDLEYRAEVDAKFSGQQNFDDQRDLCTDDGRTPEASRQVVQYQEGFRFNIVTFLLALVGVAGVVFLLFPWIVMFLFSF